MFKTKTTKSALVTSVLSLFICFAMLLGTTFAWFTDSVTSTGNIIQSGSLKVDLEVLDKDTGKWTSVRDMTGPIFNYDNWEPGYVQTKVLRVENEGSLALKWRARLISDKALSDLAKVIDVYVLAWGVQEDETVADYPADRADLTGYTHVGTLDEFINSIETTTQGALKAGEKAYLGIAFKMQETAGNEYQKQTLGEFDLQIIATQLASEEDSFGPDYDEGAALPWSGAVDTSWYDPTETTYELYTPEALAGLAAIVNGTAKKSASSLSTAAEDTFSASFAGKTVKLCTNVDLSSKIWAPIGACDSPTYFQGTFDGQGYTITGLNVDKSTDGYMYSTAGLFGWVDAASATVKNLNVDGATVKGSHWVGVIAGYWTGEISNCTVTNSTVIGYDVNDDANGDKVGGIVGYMNTGAGKLDGNTVSGTTITGNRDIAAVAGAVATTNTVTNNKAENVVLTYSENYVGEIVSPKTAVVVDDTNKATNVTIVKATEAADAEDLAGALKGTDKNISIVLSEDVDVAISALGQQTGGSGEYKLGGEETETITIDLNGHKMNITTTYWSAIGAKNPDAVFTIKNGTMTSSGNSANTWNAYDLRLCNCNYVIEDVVFEKSIALDNAGKSTSLKNVKIYDANPNTSGSYAIWITAEGQKVDMNNVYIDSTAATQGRGIKIDPQYVAEENVAKVTLNINGLTVKSEAKAAILVKSTKGADITISNINIEDVVDATNAVWVDEDTEAYADLVTVTGATKINESEVITSSDKLNKALEAGKTDLLLAAGEYNVNNGKNKTVTLTGLSKKAVIVVAHEGEYGCDYGFDGSTVTFKNVTIDTVKNNGNTWPNFARMSGNFEDCRFVGSYAPNRENVFTNCTFEVTGNAYNLWIYGASTVTMTKCEFFCDGKSIYVDGNGAAGTDLTMTECVFNDSSNGKSGFGKAAVETGKTYGQRYNLVLNKITVNGFTVNPDGLSTGSKLWANKHSMGTDKLNVVVDGVDIY